MVMKTIIMTVTRMLIITIMITLIITLTPIIVNERKLSLTL